MARASGRPSAPRSTDWHPPLRSDWLYGGRGGHPISVVLIVHIVSGAAIRKCFLNRGVLSERVRRERANRADVDGRHADPIPDGGGSREAWGFPIRLFSWIWWEETPMRRPREVGIGVLMLLGLSGCASMQQQGGWASPSRTTAFGAEDRPLSRLAFWRRPKADSDAAPVSGTVINDSSRTGMLADGTSNSSEVTSERPSLIRRFTQLGQRLRGKGEDDIDLTDRPAWKSGASPSSTLSTAYATPPFIPGTRQALIASTATATGSSRSSDAKGEVALNPSRRKPQVDEEAVPACAHGRSGHGIRVCTGGSDHARAWHADSRERGNAPGPGLDAGSGCPQRRARQLSARSPAPVDTQAQAAGGVAR